MTNEELEWVTGGVNPDRDKPAPALELPVFGLDITFSTNLREGPAL